MQGEQAYEHYHHPNYRHFNGGITQLSAYVTQAFGKRWHVYGVYDLTYKHSPDPVDSYHRHTWRFGLGKSFERWQLNAEVAYKTVDYHVYHHWYEVRRQDSAWVYQLDAKLNQWHILGLTPEISYRFTDNHSNSWIYRFRNHDIALKFSYTY